MRSRSTSTVSRYSSSVGPSYQGVLSLGDDDVVARQRRHRDALHVGQLDPLRDVRVLALDLPEALLGELDEVHLVDREHDVAEAEQRDQP